MSVTQASDGALYGTTDAGGLFGYGTVFRLTTAGAIRTLYSFNGADGAFQGGSLVESANGDFFGTTEGYGLYGLYGETHGYGTVFRMTPSGDLTNLHIFTGGADGGYPWSNLVLASDGNFYGTCAGGGAGYGTVFRITPGGALTTIHTFTNAEGYEPGLLLQGVDGDLYGLTYSGSVFRMTLAGTLTILYVTGWYPRSLAQGTDGNLYATLLWGGNATQSGAVVGMTTTGAVTMLFEFSSTDGRNPYALIAAADGLLYGGTLDYGPSGSGTLFRMTTSAGLTTLQSFKYEGDPASPAIVVQGSDGLLYGSGGGGQAHIGGAVTRISGTYAVPILSSLKPKSVNAGGPAFTLTVKGSSFQKFSTVIWNGRPLATTYISAAALAAVVPADLTVAPGTALVNVVTRAGGGSSAALSSYLIPLV